MTNVYEQVFSRLQRLTKRGEQAFSALCPAHEDRNPSLRLLVTDGGRLLAWCGAGCTFPQIVDALGLKAGDFFMPNEERKLVKAYQYLSYDRKLLFEVLRYEPKSFSQRRPNPDFNTKLPETSTNQKWIYNLQGVQRVLYNLPDLMDMVASKQDRFIFLVEGEGKANYLSNLKLLATTNPHGAGKWEQQYTDNLKGQKVIIIPDEDAPGLKHAKMVYLALKDVAASVMVCRIPQGHHQVDEWLNTVPEKDRRQALITLATTQADKDPLELIGPIEVNPAQVMLTVSRIALKLMVSESDVVDAIGYLEAAIEKNRQN